MSLLPRRLKPDDVFTPRSPQVNPDMYIQRPQLERSLQNALGGTKNIIVSGESGSGKTWLYKRVFQQNNVEYETVNLANAALKGGLEQAFADKIDRLGREDIIEKTTGGGAKIAPAGVGIDLTGSLC